jgi:transcriptional regulator with XRE-family HTH domain
MINNELIVSRIKKLMDDNNLSPSSFAKKIESKRANVSHILSGRNKPSLNFLIKIVDYFDNISLDWFMNNDSEQLDGHTGLSNLDTNIKNENTGKIKTIVHFYENGTFKIFKNSE